MQQTTLGSMMQRYNELVDEFNDLLLQHNKLLNEGEQLAASRAELTIERDLWRHRYQAAHEVMTEVEQLLDLQSLYGEIAPQLRPLQDAFNAWRQLIEAGVPELWVVAERADEQLDE